MKKEITTIPIELKKSDDNFTLNCPICGEVWEEDVCEITPCDHLKFRHIAGIDAECFGDWDHSDFDIDKVLNGEMDGVIDSIYEFEEMGVACGPVFTNILYGVKK